MVSVSVLKFHPQEQLMNGGGRLVPFSLLASGLSLHASPLSTFWSPPSILLHKMLYAICWLLATRILLSTFLLPFCYALPMPVLPKHHQSLRKLICLQSP